MSGLGEGIALGVRTPRREDRRLLAGTATFVADIALAGMVEVAFVRSPLAHARVRGVDVREAAALPGVLRVVTAADLAGVRPFPDHLRFARPVHEPPLAGDRVRYAGAPVAAVVAADRYLAEDAAERVSLDLDALPVVADIDAALAPDAPRLFDEWPDNKVLELRPSDPAVAELFARHRVVRGTYRAQRQAPVPMETRGVVAEFSRGRLTVWTSTQVPHVERTVLAEMLGLPESSVRVVAPDVGGGFGGKLHVYREDAVVAWLAIALGRPVRWIEDRREHLMASSHAREQRHEMEAAVDAEGRIVAVRCRLVHDVGAGEIFPAGVSPSFVSAASITGPYRIPHASVGVTCVVTNKAPSGAYRGFGTPEMAFALERLIEKVARETGQDPVALRRAMIIRPEDLPYTTPGGRRIDSGSYAEAFERAVAWAEERSAARRAEGIARVGVGYASYLEGVAPTYYPTSGRWTAYETSVLRVEPDGTVVVAAGVNPYGQGLETMIATITAGALGVRAADVVVRMGDTDATPYGMGSFGSRSTVLAAGAILAAAGPLRAKLVRIAAHLLGVTDAEVVLADGRFTSPAQPERSLSLADVADRAYFRTFELPSGVGPGLESTATYDPPGIDHTPDARGKMNICFAYANSTHAAVVAVDPDTGVVRILDYLAVHDAGPLLNPLVVDGQVHGGIAQGIAGALYEELVYSDDGQPLVTSFMDYLIPTAMEIPRLEVIHLSSPSPVTPLGMKGVGEAGATGPAPAIANAICDALPGRGLDIVETPIGPAALRRLLREAAARDGGAA